MKNEVWRKYQVGSSSAIPESRAWLCVFEAFSDPFNSLRNVCGGTVGKSNMLSDLKTLMVLKEVGSLERLMDDVLQSSRTQLIKFH